MSGIIINPYSFAAAEAFSTKSLEFDGVDDHVICGELPVTTTLTAFSFSLWVKVGSTTTRMNLTSSPYNAWNDNFGIYYEAGTTTLTFEQGSNVKYENTSTTLPVGTWTHLCFVFDASESTAATKSKCYINGVSILNASTTSFVQLVDLNYDLYLGCYYSAWNGSKSYFYDGNIDEVSFFNIALSSGDVSDIYNSGTPTDLTGESGLVSWWRMGENSTFKTPQILMPEQSNKDKVSNYSMDFDGTDDYIDCGISTASTDFSFSCWVKHSGTFAANYRHIAFCSLTTSNIQYGGFCCYHSTGTDLVLGVWNNKGTTQLGTGWNHIMGVWDDTTKTCELYLNGALELTYTVAAYGDISRTLEIGDLITGNYATNFDAWNGNIDEFAYWTSKLTLSDAISIYNSGTPADLTSLSPISWWRMGEEAVFNTSWLLPNKAQDVFSRYSMAFGGVDDYIDCGNGTDLQITGALTISCWVKSSDTTDYALVQKDNTSTNRSYALWGNEWGVSYQRVQFGIFNGGSFTGVSSVTDINDGNWHNVIAVFNPSTSLSIYIDGSLDAQNTFSIPATIDNDPASFQIGRAGNALYYMDGNVDEVAVWNSDQSGNAAAIFGGGTPTDLTSLSPVAWWRMGEEATFSTVWTVPDQIGSNDGTSSGMDIYSLVGEAPTTSGNGISDNMDIYDRTGDAPDSENNALSYNMDAVDIDSINHA